MSFQNKAKWLFIALIGACLKTYAQQDTLRVMAYNVLHYGSGCQGSNSFLHSQLKTIIQYSHPDILGFVKAQAIKVTPTDNNGISPYGFADSIIDNALDMVSPGEYNYCPLTNIAASNDMDILFYNQNKIGYVSVRSLCTTQEDFDLYKLYYKDPYLSSTHDTTFLYVILNHTVSGSSSAQRDQQDTIIIGQLKKIFYHLPNLISMGDFNTHSSYEMGYQAYINPSDTSFMFYDPPFQPDNNLTYPLNWESFANLCPAYLNTSTRQSPTYPNSCGTSDGAKNWYIHVFLSGWLTHNTDFVRYISNSYTTIGNDGNRIGISINDSTTNGKNSSAPENVLDALFQLSDKYPVMIELGVNYDSLGNSPADPVNSINRIAAERYSITINNPVTNSVTFHFSANALGKNWNTDWYDICGRHIASDKIRVTSLTMQMPIQLAQGAYILHLQNNDASVSFHVIKM